MPRRHSLADREPCPWRIVDDVGGAFCMGSIGGGIWHTVKGARLAPAGARLAGSFTAVSARSPVLAGQFAVWGGVFACCDCSLTSIRQKEDPWNSIWSGAITGGVLAVRAGPRAMVQAGVVGGVLLGLIEGMGIMFTKMMTPPVPTLEDYEAQQQMDITAPPTAGGLFPSAYLPSLGGGGEQTSSPDTTNTLDIASPPSTSEPFMETDGTTTFSTESTTTTDANSDANKSGGWFSAFGK